MKALFFILVSTILISGCSRSEKGLATVEIGMSKTDVSAIVGEPAKKNIINQTEIWDYTDSSRTIVFRKDTVYAIMNSPRARIDSMDVWLDSTGSNVKKGLNKIGDKLENAGDKIKNTVRRDSAKAE
ncbi:MAG: outer membrane protein assembly factor BamE [Sphingobacteriaceae bacterium]|nr:outer membrane protein assembly factor BamE [Sphingobacteriaceae bacterium]